MKHGETLVIYGIPVSATGKSTVTATEKNDTPDGYQYKATGSFASPDTQNQDFNSTTKVSADRVTGIITGVITNLAFTNYLAQISPTGVALRYAPYFLTMGAGLVALPLTKSYRKREDF